jgi:hypothetical protein
MVGRSIKQKGSTESPHIGEFALIPPQIKSDRFSAMPTFPLRPRPRRFEINLGFMHVIASNVAPQRPQNCHVKSSLQRGPQSNSRNYHFWAI